MENRKKIKIIYYVVFFITFVITNYFVAYNREFAELTTCVIGTALTFILFEFVVMENIQNRFAWIWIFVIAFFGYLLILEAVDFIIPDPFLSIRGIKDFFR